MAVVVVFAVLHFWCITNALNLDTIPEHNAYGYFDEIGIPLAKEVALEEDLRYMRPRIVGGEPTDITKFYYQAGLIVSLVNLTDAFALCGGSLISENRVATAAHCWFDGIRQGSCMEVVLGSSEVFSGGTRIQTCEVYTHPEWSPSLAKNDVAVVYLPSSVSFSKTIGPISLPSKDDVHDTFEDNMAVASGFGRLGQDITITIDQTLSEVELTIISNKECLQAYPQVITDSNLCTSGNGTDGHVAICSGDSGGPLAVKRHGKIILVGIASFGSPLGCNVSVPGGFARVTSYLKFFKLHMNNND